MHSLYNQSVILDKEAHKYWDRNGNEYMSFSRLYSFLVPKFDAENIAKHVARNSGTTSKEVLATWQQATDNGTSLDIQIKQYAETGQADGPMAHVVKHVSKKYSDYARVYSDLVVFNSDWRVAGEIDRLSLTSKLKTCTFHISDFKLFEKGMSYEAKGQRWLNAPFDHLPNTKYTKISLQLSFYAYLFEQLTKHKCEKLFIDLIKHSYNPDGSFKGHANEVIPVNYMKKEVIDILNYFKDDILKALEPKPEIIIENEF